MNSGGSIGPGKGSHEAVLVLDTNHLTELGYDRGKAIRLSARLERSGSQS